MLLIKKNIKQVVFDYILPVHFMTHALLTTAPSICMFRMTLTTNSDYLSKHH